MIRFGTTSSRNVCSKCQWGVMLTWKYWPVGFAIEDHGNGGGLMLRVCLIWWHLCWHFGKEVEEGK